MNKQYKIKYCIRCQKNTVFLFDKVCEDCEKNREIDNEIKKLKDKRINLTKMYSFDEVRKIVKRMEKK